MPELGWVLPHHHSSHTFSFHPLHTRIQLNTSRALSRSSHGLPRPLSILIALLWTLSNSLRSFFILWCPNCPQDWRRGRPSAEIFVPVPLSVAWGCVGVPRSKALAALLLRTRDRGNPARCARSERLSGRWCCCKPLRSLSPHPSSLGARREGSLCLDTQSLGMDVHCKCPFSC